MRTVLRRSILLAVPAVAALLLCVWWIHLGLEEAADVTMRQTVRLVGNELARAVGGTLDGRLQLEREAAAEDVLELLRGVATGSDLIDGLVVVDASGNQAASAPDVRARKLPPPSELFDEDPRPRLVHRSEAMREGEYELDVPLFRGDEVRGYLHLQLDTSALAEVYGASRRRLLLTAAVTAAILLLAAFAFDLQIRHRARSLAGAIEAVVRGEESPAAPRELSPVLEVAGRLGDELQRERQDRSQVRRQLTRLSNLMDMGVALMDETGRLELANRQACEMLGIDQAEGFEAERVTALLAPVRRAAASSRREHSESAVDLELPARGDRPARALRVQVFAVAEDGHEATLLLLRDRQILTSLQTDLRMATQLRSLSHLLMGVAHDLKAPLNAIVLNLEVLRQQLHNDSAAEGTLRTIGDELRRLERLLELLLSQAAPPEQQPQEVDLAAVVRGVGELIEPQARQQRVDPQITVECEPASVHGYADQLRQAILNLAINGLEAMPDGGTLELHLRRENGEYCLLIRDTGAGIPEEVRSRIFDLHFTTKDTGTGVGLHVVRSVVESIGGRVEVSRTGREGTVLALHLPVPKDDNHFEEGESG